MTRINANIAPRLLSDNHLIAEFREIHRLKKLHETRKKNGSNKDIPEGDFFTLGKGHLLFFMDKYYGKQESPEITINRLLDSL